eukprot:TRINITY_DN715_c0_g1_i1.p2 TRINITY_DN715_c0_g1~~TRINITY_DN715_c0_g1_i1.p2  ORF type:complete len:196 (+),score=51.19 TRINITY_DN715_c0_g1_i1:1416-2003(+)
MSNVFKLVLVGSGGVGKSCLTIQYISNKFVEDYDPTLEDSYRKPITLDGEPAILDIFDTAGQEDFAAVRDSYMRTGDGFLCVYSVTLQASFDEAVNLHEHILRVKDAEEVPFVLVGNKCDLEDAREVTFEKGQSLANDLNCPFLEASAKTRYNVDESFTTLVKEIQKQSRDTAPDPPTATTTAKPARRGGGCQLL